MRSNYSRIKNLPKFVMMMQDGKKGCAMRFLEKDEFVPGRGIYWRDAGLWGIDARLENGKLVSDAKIYGEELQYLDGQELIPITEEEWRTDNGQYAPSLKKIKESKDIHF